ncbi:MAG: polyhydroxyalkanoic acid system family protein [Pirellulales bacterium]|nr:polyhydroxyalkanoic acid system family protein [Planctomycetales bacterium]
MPSLAVSVPHSLEHDEVIERLKHFAEIVKESYGERVSGLTESWRDDGLDFAFSALGFSTTGQVTVDSNIVRVDSTLPAAALFFKGRIERGLQERLERLLR